MMPRGYSVRIMGTDYSPRSREEAISICPLPQQGKLKDIGFYTDI